MKKLSVVVPTLNCLGMLRGHIETMRDWMHLADEIIVVDSFSDDGCLDYAREHLRHPGLRLLSHPRGLYQSWNYGIAQTTGEWIYISTVGDQISAAQLEKLMDAGRGLEADVVISSPRFVDVEGEPTESMRWPVELLVEETGLKSPSRLPFLGALILSLRHLPMSVLGSSASNVYRGEHLRARPFPLEFSTIGDVGWGLRHLFDTRFAVVPEVGSTFRLHPKVYTPLDLDRLELLCEKLREEARGMLERAKGADGGDPRVGRVVDLYFDIVPGGKKARDDYRELRRRPGPPWWLMREGWAVRSHKLKMRRVVAAAEREAGRLLIDALAEANSGPRSESRLAAGG